MKWDMWVHWPEYTDVVYVSFRCGTCGLIQHAPMYSFIFWTGTIFGNWLTCLCVRTDVELSTSNKRFSPASTPSENTIMTFRDVCIATMKYWLGMVAQTKPYKDDEIGLYKVYTNTGQCAERWKCSRYFVSVFQLFCTWHVITYSIIPWMYVYYLFVISLIMRTSWNGRKLKKAITDVYDEWVASC